MGRPTPVANGLVRQCCGAHGDRLRARRATAELLEDSGDSGMPGEETLATARERAISVGAARPRDLCRGCAWRSDLVAAPNSNRYRPTGDGRARTHCHTFICIASRLKGDNGPTC